MRRRYGLVPVVVFSFSLFATAAPRVDRVEPDEGPSHRSFQVALEGDGFDEGTRISLLDAGLTPLGGYDFADPVSEVFYLCASGSSVYLFDDVRRQLHVVDASDPENPWLVSTLRLDVLSARPISMECIQDTVYVPSGPAGLVVIDVSDPAQPTRLAVLDTPGWATKIAFDGYTGYLNDSDGIAIIDVSDPAAPSQLGYLPLPGYDPGHIAASGGYAYFSDFVLHEGPYIRVVDARNPAFPAVVGSLPLEDPSAYPHAQSLTARGDRLFASLFNAGLWVFDLEDPSSPELHETYRPEDYSVGFAAVDGDVWYVVEYGDDVQRIRAYGGEIGDDSELLGWTYEDRLSRLAFGAGVLYASVRRDGLRIFATDLRVPPPEAEIAVPVSLFSEPAIVGSRAYVAGLESELAVVNLERPDRPFVESVFDYPVIGRDERIRQTHAMAGYLYGITHSDLFVYDLSDPTEPRRISYLQNGGGDNFTLASDHAFVRTSFGSLLIVDLSNPALPQRVGVYRTHPQILRVAGGDRYLYLTDYHGGVQILDVDDPSDPQQLSRVQIGSLNYTSRIAVSGDLLFIAAEAGRLLVFDVRDRTAPVGVATAPGVAYPIKLHAVGNRVYLLDLHDGFRVYDTTTSSNPVLVSRHYGFPNSSTSFSVGHGVLATMTNTPTLQVRRDNPPVGHVTVENPGRVTATIPAGYKSGPYRVRVTGGEGSADTHLDTFEVLENRPPTADAGAGVTEECTSPAGAVVRLDGSASTDPDSTPGTNDDIARFEWYSDFGLPTEQPIAVGERVDVELPLGTRSLVLRVTDLVGAQDTDDVEITVTDTTPPSVSVAVTPEVLWPPNHKMTGVDVTVAVLDVCGNASFVLDDVLVGGSSGIESDDVEDAEVGTADVQIELRAERHGSSQGRVYTVVYSARDSSGNTATAEAEVRVPHDSAGARR